MNNSKTIYVFSGLGADKRVFQKINFGAYNVVYINWELPLQNENLQQYAKRIAEQITDAKPILLGISFGGIVAQEVASQIEIQKLFLLASIELRSEIPWYLRMFGNLQIDKLMPARIMKKHNFAIDFLFGVQTKENSLLLKNILADTDEKFLKWALRQIAIWNPAKNIDKKLKITIHGTRDKILLKVKNKKYDFEIMGGGHFFTLTHYSEINSILEKKLSKSQSSF